MLFPPREFSKPYSNILQNVRIGKQYMNVKKMTGARRREIEEVMKGVANHRRLQILELLAEEPGLSVFGIAETLDTDFRTISQHTRRLARAGLVTKKYEGRVVHHTLTSRGKNILTFCRMLE